MTLARLHLISLTAPEPHPGPLELQLRGRTSSGEDALRTLPLPVSKGRAATSVFSQVAPLDLELTAGVLVVLVVPALATNAYQRVQGAASISEKAVLQRRFAHDGILGSLTIATAEGPYKLTYRIQLATQPSSPQVPARHCTQPKRTRLLGPWWIPPLCAAALVACADASETSSIESEPGGDIPALIDDEHAEDESSIQTSMAGAGGAAFSAMGSTEAMHPPGAMVPTDPVTSFEDTFVMVREGDLDGCEVRPEDLHDQDLTYGSHDVELVRYAEGPVGWGQSGLIAHPCDDPTSCDSTNGESYTVGPTGEWTSSSLNAWPTTPPCWHQASYLTLSIQDGELWRIQRDFRSPVPTDPDGTCPHTLGTDPACSHIWVRVYLAVADDAQ